MAIAHSEQLVGLNLVAYNGPEETQLYYCSQLFMCGVFCFPVFVQAHKLREQQRCSFILIPPQWGLNFLDLVPSHTTVS